VAEDRGGGALAGVSAGGPLDPGAARVAFARRGALLLLAASRRAAEPPAALRALLDAAHRQLLLVCAGGIEHALKRRPGLDVRELLGEDRPQTPAGGAAEEEGATAAAAAAAASSSSSSPGGASALDAALRLLSRQASACAPLCLFGAVEPCPGLPAPVRRAAGVALAAALRATGALYGLVAAVPVVVVANAAAPTAAAPWLLPLPAGEHRPYVLAAERGPLPPQSSSAAAAGGRGPAAAERLAPLLAAPDLQALMLLLQSSPALRQPDLQDAAFVPVCLPHVSPAAFLHACVGCLGGLDEARGPAVPTAAAAAAAAAGAPGGGLASAETRVQMFAVLIAQSPDASPRMAAACRQLEAALRHVGALPAAAVAAAAALRAARWDGGDGGGGAEAAPIASPLAPSDPSLPLMLWHYCLRYPGRQQLVSAPFTAGPFAMTAPAAGDDDDGDDDDGDDDEGPRLPLRPQKLRREAYRAYAALHAAMYGGAEDASHYWPPAAVDGSGDANDGSSAGSGNNAAAFAPHPHYARQARPAAEAEIAASAGGSGAAASSPATSGSAGVAAAAASLLGLSVGRSAATPTARSQQQQQRGKASGAASTTAHLCPPLASAAFVRGDRWAAVALAGDDDDDDADADDADRSSGGGGVEAYALLDPLATRAEALAAATLLRRLYALGTARAADMLVAGL